MFKKSPTMIWSTIGFGVSLIGTGALVLGLGWDLILSWFLVINLMTFSFYGLDKFQARRDGARIPEVVLLGMVAAGGTPLALLARQIFHHKTIKRGFRAWLWLIIVVQLILIGWAAYRFIQGNR